MFANIILMMIRVGLWGAVGGSFIFSIPIIGIFISIFLLTVVILIEIFVFPWAWNYFNPPKTESCCGTNHPKQV